MALRIESDTMNAILQAVVNDLDESDLEALKGSKTPKDVILGMITNRGMGDEHASGKFSDSINGIINQALSDLMPRIAQAIYTELKSGGVI